MFGDIVPIAPGTLFIEGLDPKLILREPDIASVVLHKAGDTLYVMDTGATLFFRQRIIDAAESLRPFERLVLLNSHGHPDHTPNNAVIGQIEASRREHYISRAGIPLLDHFARIASDFKAISRYYFVEDGPGFPFSLLMRPLKLLRLFKPSLIDQGFVNLMARRIMKKFEPLEPSKETAACFEDSPSVPLPIKGAALTGWMFGDDVLAIESRGHTPDSISFYIPKAKVLFLADETTDWFNCWADSSAARVTSILHAALGMYREGQVDVLIGGHQQEAFRGEKIPELIERLLDQHRTFLREIGDIVNESPKGITARRIYGRLKARRSIPAIDRFFRIEFPKMPGMLKTAIVFALLEAGFTAEGRPGRARFHPPAAKPARASSS